ncbi:MAG TPA: hypothetical protein VJN21_15755 [Candidatus Acidoferrales bacterium]|nr:hypothetical protein [Candidatus Acidoferrales bacterium]
MLLQNVSTFGSGSLNGNGVMRLSGFTSGVGADINLGLFTGNGGGTFTGVLDTNNAGTFTGQQALSGTYTTATDGQRQRGSEAARLYSIYRTSMRGSFWGQAARWISD